MAVDDDRAEPAHAGTLTGDMQRMVREQRLAFVATVRPDGGPNVSPKGTIAVVDPHHLLFADVSSPGTVANLRHDPRIELNVVDPIARRGYRFRGVATIHTADTTYAEGLALLAENGSTLTAEHVRSIVLVRVDEARPVRSPAYDLGAHETEVVTRWLDHHRRLHEPGPD